MVDLRKDQLLHPPSGGLSSDHW